MPTPLSEAAITEALAHVDGWGRAGDAIETELEAATFAAAVALVVRIGFLAEAADHHPDLDLRWRTVKVSLTSHDAGGLTDRDFTLARAINEVRPQ